jgi:DNA-binding NarL/FixJ family response regulator
LKNGRPTVVFAEDNVKVAQGVCTILDPAYKVMSVAIDGEEALRTIQELNPDFAVLDISMPKLDGLAVARRLRQAKSTTRVIFMSFIDDDDYRHEARLVGHGYVLKRRLSCDLLTVLESAQGGFFFCSY